ncbi:MAG: type II secretion system F family protein [Phycisphaerales bacterium]
MKLAYQAYDTGGKATSGTIDAPSAEAARQQLRRQGLFATRLAEGSLAPKEEPRPAGGGLVGALSGRGKHVAQFTRQLAVLVSTGTPVVEALAVLEKQVAEGAWRNILINIRSRVEEGAQLSEALAAHAGWFDPVCRSLVAAGESRGKLGEMLVRAADLLRQQQKVRGAVAGAMVYPILLVFVAISTVVGMVGFVLPRFEGLFSTLGAGLPPTTKFLMDISRLAREHWLLMLVGLAAVGGGTIFWLVSARGQRFVSMALVRLPMIGRVTRSLATARIARMMGVLLEGKVNMLEALTLTRAGSSSPLYAALLQNAIDQVTRGELVSQAFGDATLIHPSVCEAIRSGERTGQVGPVLSTVADFLDEDNETLVKSLTSIIEPVILIGMGLVVGAVALSMFMPLFDLTGGGMGPPGGAPAP